MDLSQPLRLDRARRRSSRSARSASPTTTSRSPQAAQPRPDRARQALPQFLVALAVGCAIEHWPATALFSTVVTFPFLKKLLVDLGILYVPFVAVVVVGSSNAVNLTDGLDGLAIGAVGHRRGDLRVLAYVAGNAVAAALPPDPVRPAVRRARGLLRRARRRLARLPLVQLPSGRGLHGRRRLAPARRRDRRGRGDDQAGDAARDRRRPLRARGALGDHPGRVVQARRAGASSGWRRSTTTSSCSAGRSRA